MEKRYFNEVSEFINLKLLIDLKEQITDFHIGEIKNIIKEYDKDFLVKGENKLLIANFIKHNVDGDWVDRIKLIRTKFNRDSSTLGSFKCRFGDLQGTKMWKEKTKKTIPSLDNKLRKYGEEGIKKWDEYREGQKSIGIENMIAKYGEKKGKEKWGAYLNKWKKSIEEKGGWDNGLTLELLQNKHGIEKGFEVWKKKSDKQKERFSEKYYVKKYGEDIGIRKWKEYCLKMDKKSLNYFVDRYGNEKGKKYYEISCNKNSFSQSVEGYKIKFGNIEGEKRHKLKTIINIKKLIDLSCRGYSKVSQRLFWEIYEHIDISEKKNCRFAELNEEETFYIFDNIIKSISVDFKLNKKIIEFFGDFWHANPKIFKDDDEVKMFHGVIKKAKDIREKDRKRIEILKNLGYEVLIVWEKDYNKTKQEVINRCLKFLNL